MIGQIESHHYFITGDTLQRADGQLGVVTEASALYALVRWDDGRREELDQFDPQITVVRRADPS